MFLGAIFFPLYLTHGIMFWWARYFMADRLQTWSHWQVSTLLLSVFAGCIGLSTILNRVVEKRAHTLGRRCAAAKASSARSLNPVGLYRSPL